MSQAFDNMFLVDGAAETAARASGSGGRPTGEAQTLYEATRGGVAIHLEAYASEPVRLDRDNGFPGVDLMRLSAPGIWYVRVLFKPAVQAVAFTYLSGSEHELNCLTSDGAPIEGSPETGWVPHWKLGLRTVNLRRVGPIGIVEYYCGRAGAGPRPDALWLAPFRIIA